MRAKGRQSGSSGADRGARAPRAGRPGPTGESPIASRGSTVATMLAGAAALGVLASCATETEVVRWDPPLAGLPGAESGMSVKRKGAGGGSAEVREYTPDELRVQNEDGSVTLVSRTGKHLIGHIARTLRESEEELFTEQVLSEMTRREFISRGYDPAEAYRELKRLEVDVNKLFQRMPNGEFTPGVFLKKVGDGVFRMQSGGPAGDLRWTFMDMVFEKGSWRLRWFG